MDMDMELMKDLGLMATEDQLDYIDSLLEHVDCVLDEYTDTPRDELTKEEASDIIDEIKLDYGLD